MSKSFRYEGDRFERQARKARKDARNYRRERQHKHWPVDVIGDRDDIYPAFDNYQR